MDMSGQGAAILAFFIICMFCGPFYAAFLLYGFVRRRELVASAFAKWLYIVSFPLALGFIGLMRIFGTEEINASDPIGTVLTSMALVSLGMGLLTAMYILFKTERTPHK